MKILFHSTKVFEEKNGSIYLWEPVKEFIIKEYKKILYVFLVNKQGEKNGDFN